MRVSGFNRWTRWFLVLAVASVVTQCGGNNADSKLDLKVIPDSPIVFTTDLTFIDPATDTQVTIPAPFIRFSVQMTNNYPADSKLYLVVLAFKLTPTTPDGTTTGTPVGLAPVTTDPSQIAFFNLGPGKTGDSEVLYLGSMPKNSDPNAYNYRIKIEVEGYLSDVSDCTSCTTEADNEAYALANPTNRLSYETTIYSR